MTVDAAVLNEFRSIEYFMTDSFLCGILALTHKMPCSRTPSRNNVKQPSVKIPLAQKDQHVTPVLRSSDGLANTGTTLSGAKVLLAANNDVGLLDDLLTLGKDQLDVAGVGHVGVDLFSKVSTSCILFPFSRPGFGGVRTRPWARYVRRRCLGAWLT